jgi:hypothetical protein
VLHYRQVTGLPIKLQHVSAQPKVFW